MIAISNPIQSARRPPGRWIVAFPSHDCLRPTTAAAESSLSGDADRLTAESLWQNASVSARPHVLHFTCQDMRLLFSGTGSQFQ